MYFPEIQKEFEDSVNGLRGRRVAVLGHLRPDGDCVGSQVAMCRALRARGVDAFCVNKDPIPRILSTFVGDTPYFGVGEFDSAGVTAVTVDCADKVRVGKDLEAVFPEVYLNVDHHISNDSYAAHNFIVDNSSATAEILAGLFFDGGFEIDSITAQALYIGIATDTGQFRFGSTTQQVFEICSRLTDAGADPAAAAMELYENESVPKLRLLQHFLESLRFECRGRVCIGLLKNGVYGETGADKEDSEGLVDYARAINGVEIGVLVEERDGAIKGSFRAKDPRHRVDQLARNFNGGGHACAAGFNFHDSLESFYPSLVETLEVHFEALEGAVFEGVESES